MRATTRALVATVAAAAVVLSGCSRPDNGESAAFYDGKDLEWLTPFDPGGGNDIQARYFTPLLEETIPGSPRIQVVNRGGAGGVIGTNEDARRDPDGSSVVWTTGSTNISWLLREEGVEFDFATFTPIFAVPSGIIAYVASDTGIESVRDIRNSTKELVFGAQSATGSGAVLLMAWEMLGIKPKTVFGYGSGGEVVVAFEQNEINLANASTAVYNETIKQWVDDGTAVPLFSLGQIENGELVRDPAFPDVPHLGEAYEMIHGRAPSGELWDAYLSLVAAQNTYQKIAWMHGDAPREAVEAIREGMAQVIADQKDTQQWLDIMGEYEVIVDDVENQVRIGLLDTPASVGEYINSWLEEHYPEEVG